MPQNIKDIESFFNHASHVLISLQSSDGDVIVRTRKSTGFIGFLMCMKSCLALSKDLFEVDFSYVLSYKFSQDHLELFFNGVRRSCGWNDNPTALQLRYIMRRFLAHAGVESASTGNCQLPPAEFKDVLEETTIDPSDLQQLSPFVGNVTVYIAGFVVRKVLRHLSCPECRLSLISSATNAPSSTHFLRLKNNGGLVIPSKDVVTIIQRAEKIVRSYPQTQPATVVPKVLGNMVGVDVFSNFHFVQHGHRYTLLQSIVTAYCSIRSHHICKSRNAVNISRRTSLHKQIHFRNF